MFDYNNFQARNKCGVFCWPQWQQFGGFCRNGGGTGGDCFGAPRDSIRYDSPTFGGFSVSASWGEDDFWDASARYAGEWNGIKVAVAAAYSQWTCDFGGSNQPFNGGTLPGGAIVGANGVTGSVTDFGCGDGVAGINQVQNIAVVGGNPAAVIGDKDSQYFQLGAYVEHVPTGLWAYGAYGRLETNAAVFSI